MPEEQMPEEVPVRVTEQVGVADIKQRSEDWKPLSSNPSIDHIAGLVARDHHNVARCSGLRVVLVDLQVSTLQGLFDRSRK